ncbi:MAG: hypothetical protein JSS57_07260 [Proteobacteria bacterium]|nr:hypothetical protein [Pseudomonadota bacterium]
MAQRGGKRENAGRKPGIPNRRTIGREIVSDVIFEEIQKRNAGQRRGMTVLETQMNFWMNRAAKIQRDNPNNCDKDKDFRYAMDQAGRFAMELTKYQVPKFKSIDTREPPPLPKAPTEQAPAAAKATKTAKVVDITEGRPDDEVGNIYARLVRGAR